MRVVHGLLAIGLALAIWQLIVILTSVPSFILPPPLTVMKTWFESRVLIAEHSLATGTAILLGLTIGVLLGVSTALLLAASKTIRLMVRPMLVFTQALPVFALAPILTLWLGFGIGSKVAMAVLIIYFPVTSAFFDGLVRTPPAYLDLASTMGASRQAVLWQIKIPAALPALGSGLRLAAVSAPIGAVIGEWVGASQGLGYLMLLANGRAKTDLMFAALLTLGVLSVTLYLLINWLVLTVLHHHAPAD
ncbi:MAG: ABC transporter permease [Rhodobacteraceae bacterium]|nr:ABC transporter permease [Paracoccaceae bacterium]